MKFYVYVLALLWSVSVQAQTPRVEILWQWYQQGYYILNPTIAHSNAEVAFVRRLSGKDSTVQASSFFRGVFKNYLSAGTSDRFFDPVICILDKNKKLTLIDYGWDPAYSKDDKKIAYAYQVKTLKKGDPLYAEAYQGNEIKVFDKSAQHAEAVAKPLSNNYLMDPFFLDSMKVVYKIGTKVNGPYGAGISFNQVDLQTKKTSIIRLPGIKYRLYELMGEAYLINNQLAYTLYSPTDTGRGMANEYLHLLLTEKDTLQDFGIRRFTLLDNKIGFNDKNEIIFLDDELLLPEDTVYVQTYKDNRLIRRTPLQHNYVKSYLSPNGTYMVYITEGKEAFLLNLITMRRAKINIPEREIYTIVWAKDSQRLAIVQEHESLVGTDILHLLQIR